MIIKLTSILVPDVGIRAKAEQDEHHLRVARVRACPVNTKKKNNEAKEEDRRNKIGQRSKQECQGRAGGWFVVVDLCSAV